MAEIDAVTAALIAGGGGGTTLLGKILFDWLKGNKNGKEDLSRKIDVKCPYNGQHARAQLGKMDELIKEIALKHNIDPALIQRLVEYEQTKVHLQKRRGARDDLRLLIEQHIEEQSR